MRATLRTLPEEEANLAHARRNDPPRAEDPDGPDLRRALSGDPAAFGAIVERHHERLRRLVAGIVADRQLVEDVLQDVYMTAYKNLAGFRQEALLGTWLARIAVREAFSAASKWRLRRRHRTLEENGVELEWEARTPQQVLADQDEAFALLRCLPRRERMAFVLFVEGWSYEEIGRIARRPMGTIATWIHRARERLARRLPGRSESRRRPAGEENAS